MPHVTVTIVTICKNEDQFSSVLILSRGYVHSIKNYEWDCLDKGLFWKVSTSHLRSEKLDKLIIKRSRELHGSEVRLHRITVTNIHQENIHKLVADELGDYPGDMWNAKTATAWKPLLVGKPYLREMSFNFGEIRLSLPRLDIWTGLGIRMKIADSSKVLHTVEGQYIERDDQVSGYYSLIQRWLNQSQKHMLG